jgi:hypothetical protein
MVRFEKLMKLSLLTRNVLVSATRVVPLAFAVAVPTSWGLAPFSLCSALLFLDGLPVLFLGAGLAVARSISVFSFRASSIFVPITKAIR